MHKGGISYTSTMVEKEERIEVQKNTDIFLDIPKGIQGIIIAAVHADPTPFLDIIPDDECIIAPIVTLNYKPRSNKYSLELLKANPENYFTLLIPHIVKENRDAIIVRSGCSLEFHGKKSGYQLISRKGYAKTGSHKGIFTLDAQDKGNIQIETQQFSAYICTSTDHRCEKEAVGLIYGVFLHENLAMIRVYLANSLYKKKAHRSVSIKYFFTTIVNQNDFYTCYEYRKIY